MENTISSEAENKKNVYSLREVGREHIALLHVRERQKRKKPKFVRQESWRYKRVASSWRRPRGIDSRMRLKERGWSKTVGVGYRSPKAVRGFHPSGFEEVLVNNVKDLEKINPNHLIRIGHTVGLRKRVKIIEKARELGLRILNVRGVDVDGLE